MMARYAKRKETRRGRAPQRAFTGYETTGAVRSPRRVGVFWKILLGLFLTGVTAVLGVFAWAWLTIKVPNNLDTVNDQLTTIFYSDGVTPLGTLAKERRILVNYKDLPEYVGNAVVASEDQTFWTNMGVSPKGIARAFYTNVRYGTRQGGSTITQQYVERYYTDSVSDYVGKAKEALLAMKITHKEEKEEILEGYLNTIYWGRGTYGIEAASQAYFGHPASELTVSEAALLAGIIPSPSRWDPSVNEAQAKARWQRTLDYMVSSDYITQKQADKAKFPKYLPKPNYAGANAGQAGYLINEVVRELRQAPQFANDPETIETRGLHIVTTIDKKLQDEAVKIWDEIPREGKGAASPQLQMALVSLNPTNGEYKALYGGQDYATVQFNYATDGRAQAGSTFKPFTLIAALEDGHQLYERFNGNSGIPIEGWDSKSNLRNYGGISYGTIDLLKATEQSVNTVYAQLNIEVGPQKTADVAHKLGIPNVTDPNMPGYIAGNPANVLGTASVRPVDLARAYATIAGQGFEITPHIVREVSTLNGDLIYRGNTERVQVADPEIMAATTYALEQVVKYGSGKTASQLKGPEGERRDIAGKTGTANENLAAWFAGYTPQLVTVVGLHQDTEDGRGEESITPFGKWREMTGSSFPVTAWTEFMQVALEGVPVEKFPAYTPPPAPPVEPEEVVYCTDTDSDAEDCVPVVTCQGDESDIPECVPPTSEPGSDGPAENPAGNLLAVPTGLEGKSVGDVVALLQALGFVPVVDYVESDVMPDTVIEVQSAGLDVPFGSTITLTVAATPVVQLPEPGPGEPELPLEPQEPLPDPELVAVP